MHRWRNRISVGRLGLSLPISKASRIAFSHCGKFQSLFVTCLPSLSVTIKTPFEVGLVVGNASFLGATELLVLPDVLAKGRICEHYIEPSEEYTVNVNQAIVIVNAAVAVAVHDHVHLGGAGGLGSASVPKMQS